jgi:hypothetical protein
VSRTPGVARSCTTSFAESTTSIRRRWTLRPELSVQNYRGGTSYFDVSATPQVVPRRTSSSGKPSGHSTVVRARAPAMEAEAIGPVSTLRGCTGRRLSVSCPAWGGYTNAIRVRVATPLWRGGRRWCGGAEVSLSDVAGPGFMDNRTPAVGAYASPYLLSARDRRQNSCIC